MNWSLRRSRVGRTAGLLLCLAVAASCASTSSPGVATERSNTDPDGAGDDGSTVGDEDPSSPGASGKPGSGGSAGDPFGAQPDESEGLTNATKDLDALLEHGALEGACDRYRDGQTDRKTMLTCGKWMFFYETFQTAGIPLAIVKFFANELPNELGLGYSKLGLVPDPGSDLHLPLGLAKTVPMGNNVDAVAFTCASCHFGKIADGRYVVGAPNHTYDYAGHILTIALAASVGLGMTKAADHDPAAVAKLKPVLDKLADSFALRAKLGVALAPLASLQQPKMSKSVEHQYATWPNGALDFVIAPLPVDDGAHVVGKILPLWGIPRDAERAAAKMPSALLAWSGSAETLTEFIEGFAILGGAAAPSAEEMKPLVEYLYSLRAPENPARPDAALAARGAKLFAEKKCTACHDGPRGSGRRAFTFAEIGSDDALAGWLDPKGTGDACCDVPVKKGGLTHGVKSPRLVGLWAQRRFLHNGTLSSLEELFCMKPRPAGQKPLATTGHTFTCDGLADDEKNALLAYLRSH